jgi:hypothetical protein
MPVLIMTLEFRGQNSRTPHHELVIIACIVFSEDRRQRAHRSFAAMEV